MMTDPDPFDALLRDALPPLPPRVVTATLPDLPEDPLPAPESVPAAPVGPPPPVAPEQPVDRALARALGERPDRSTRMKIRHREALDRVFGIPGCKYEILKEITLPEGQKFKTPFGNYGRHGWIIRLVGSVTPDNERGVLYTIGKGALMIAINEYHVIDPLPVPPRGRPPKAEASE